MRYQFFLAFVVVISTVLPNARGTDFTSPEGFSLTYPDAWKGLTPKDIEKVEARAKKAGVPSPLHSNPETPLTLIRPKGKALSPALIVMQVQAAPFHLFPGLAESTAAQMKMSFKAQGVPEPEIKISELKVNGHDGFALAYELQIKNAKEKTKNWMVMFPSQRGCCTLTCSAPTSEWKDAAKDFKTIFNSLNFVDAPK